MHDTLLAQYAEREAQMNTIYAGDVLRRIAQALGGRLGSGPLVLLSTTRQGAGLAAACAAGRSEPTWWRQIDLLLAPELPDGATPVFVEIVDPGGGWQDFALARYPGARFVFADSAPVLKVA